MHLDFNHQNPNPCAQILPSKHTISVINIILIYIYIYITETSETLTIFHVSTIFK